MAIKCGHCKEAHGTIAQVKACSLTPNIPAALRRPSRTFTEADERDMQRMEMEGDRAETARDEAAKAAWKASVETPDTPALSDLISRVDELLCIKTIPVSEHGWSRAVRRMISGEGNVITAHGLRTAIARLEAFPSVPVLRGAPATQEGLYRLKGNLYQVVRSKNQRLYAKLVTFVDGKKRPILEYANGVIYDLTADHLVPIEEAQALTRKTGWCVFGHFLTKPESIARGMGDTCYSRYPHLAKNVAS